MQDFARRIEVAHWAVSIFGVIASAGIWLVFARTLPPQVPLFYSLPWGEGQLVSPSGLFLLPVIGLVSALLAGVLANRFIKEVLLKIMVIFTSVIVQLVLILSLVRIIFLIS